LAAYILTVNAQKPTSWTNPYFYYHYNTQLDLPTQKVSADEKAGNQQQLFTNYNDHSMQNTLGSHVVLLTTCLRDLKSKLRQKKIFSNGNSDKLREKLFSATKADLVHTHSETGRNSKIPIKPFRSTDGGGAYAAIKTSKPSVI
jgi:hypothetical protein